MFALCCHDYSNKETPWIMLGIRSYSFFPWNGCSLTFSVRVNDYWAIKQWRMHSRVMMGVLHSALLHNQLVFLAVGWWVATSCLVELSVYKYFLRVNTILSYLLHLPPLSLSLLHLPSLSLSPGFTPMAKVIRDLVSGEPDSQESRYEHETT